MKLVKFLVILFFVSLSIPSCTSAEKATKERQNFMMPKTTELRRNRDFAPSKDKKTYKDKKKKKKSKKKKY